MKLEFFGRIFKAKRSKTEPFEVIDIDSLRDLLEDELEKEKSEILRECKSLFSEIKTGVERIQSIANRISESKIPEDIPKKIYKAAVTSKPAFINGILNSVGPFKGYKLSNFDDIEKFHKTLESSLSDIAKISVSKGRYLPVVFGEEMEQIRRESKYLLNKSKEIKEKLEDSRVTQIEGFLNKIDEIKRCKDKISSLDIEIANILKRIKSQESEREGMERKLQEINTSEKSREFREYREELQNVRNRIDRIETQIYNSINPLGRALRKYRRHAEISMKNDVVRVIDSYLNDLVNALLSDRENRIKDILTEIEDSIQKDRLEIREKERDKILRRISHLRNLDMNRIRNSYNELKKREIELMKRTKELSLKGDKEEIEREIKHMKREIEESKEELEKCKKRIEKLRNKIGKIKEELCTKLQEIMGRELRIKF